MINPKQYAYNAKAIKYGENDLEYTVVFNKIPHISGNGKTPEAALKEAYSALDAYLKYCEKKSIPIPEPDIEMWDETYSGKITLRMPKNLHKELVNFCENDGMSINSVINDAIRKYIENEKTQLLLDTAKTKISYYIDLLGSNILIRNRIINKSTALKSFPIQYQA